MCLLKPLKVKEIKGSRVVLENGINAYLDEKMGKVEPNDEVLVFGNLVIEKVERIKNER